MNREQAWEEAERYVLQDVDTRADWEYGECMNRRADESYAKRVVLAIMNGRMQPAEIDTATLVYIRETEVQTWSILARVADTLRQRYLQTRQDDVHARFLQIAECMSYDYDEDRQQLARDAKVAA